MADIMPPPEPSAQPATPLLATRDTLAAALRAPTGYGTRYVSKDLAELLADHLLASGVVRDPATLADDETLTTAIRDANSHWFNVPEARAAGSGMYALRALAAALTEDQS